MKKPIPIDEHGNPIPNKYDPSDFLIAPTDSRGVSYRLSFRVSPDMVRAIDQILGSNRFPMQTRGDVLRFFTMEGIRMIEQMEPVISVSHRVKLMNIYLTEENSHAEFMQSFDQLQDMVNKYIADHAPEQAIRIIARAKHEIQMMPEGHWREKYLRELSKRFDTVSLTGGQNGSGSGSGQGGINLTTKKPPTEGEDV